MAVYNALLRTHHITSRAKVARLRKAAHRLGVSYVLLRCGGSPGLMYVEGVGEEGVRAWVEVVQNLRYKDFARLCRPAPLDAAAALPGTDGRNTGCRGDGATTIVSMGFEEVDTVARFASEMEKRGLLGWWKRAMGYSD